ncbi:MAG: hypothetical protein ABSH45_07990 [Bryobacteraceae bacterium]|jgi:hypothetical protein
MALRALIGLARRRLFWNGLLAEGVGAASIGLGALVLLLVAGTSLLRWEWLVPVPLAAAAWGFYRAWRRRPSAYRTACTVDRRLTFADALATAFHFSQPDHAPVSEELRQLQFDQAERLAAAADARSAVPWVVPRSTFLLVALVAVASGLFALRYGLSRRLDLRPPLARMIERELGIHNPPRLLPRSGRPNRATSVEPEPPSDADPGNDRSDGAAQEANIDEEIAQALGNHPDSKPGDSARQQGTARTGGTKGEDGRKGPSADRSSAAPSESADASQKSERKADEGQNRDSKENAGGDGESSSLISKVKDAFENLLSKMKPQQSNPGSQEQSSRDQDAQKPGKGQQNAAKPQSAQNGQPSGDRQGDSEDSQTAEKSQNVPDPSGKGSGKSQAQASKQPGSGVGSQEGDKSIKLAEQLVAMGKITEIIGKRSANLTGEATVEVKSTTQQLHTQYAQRSAQHVQTGSSISRDEVPVALQAYVVQYFEQVRKQPAPAGARKKP